MKDVGDRLSWIPALKDSLKALEWVQGEKGVKKL